MGRIPPIFHENLNFPAINFSKIENFHFAFSPCHFCFPSFFVQAAVVDFLFGLPKMVIDEVQVIDTAELECVQLKLHICTVSKPARKKRKCVSRTTTGGMSAVQGIITRSSPEGGGSGPPRHGFLCSVNVFLVFGCFFFFWETP